MGTSYTLDHTRRLVLTHASGKVTTADVRDLYSRLLADSMFSPSYQHLADWRGVTSFTMTTDAIRDAAQLSSFDAGVRRAVVVDTDAAYGIARMFATHADATGQVVRVFRDMTEAEAWLAHAPYSSRANGPS